METKRAIVAGIIAYAISFAFGIVTGLILGIDFSTAESAPDSVWIIGIFGTSIIALFSALWYFKKVKPSAKEGFYLGIIFVITAFVIEAILVIPYILLSNSPASIQSYYTNPLLWISIIILVITTTATGGFKAKKK